MSDGQKNRLSTTVFGQSLSAAREGASAARGAIFEACRAYLLLFASREVRADLRAKVSPSDLVQETFVEAHRHFARFDGATKRELVSWLRGILRHRLMKAQRKFRATAKRNLAREIPFAGFSSVIVPGVSVPAQSGLPGQQLIAE
jgi:RNA polymerase sigma-70 factor (ECF subfamily)